MYRRKHLEEIERLDPRQDFLRISQLSGGYEFPWDSHRSLEFALFRTYCVPTISALLNRTGEFKKNGQRRYDDTALLINEIVSRGYDDPRGKSALERMNQIHAHFDISNEEYLYVLTTFIYVPIDWIDSYGYRKLTQKERLAAFYLWRKIGIRMGIQNIPADYDELKAFAEEYERTYFVYSDDNRAVGDATVQVFLNWFPRLLWAPVRKAVYAMLDERMLTAFGYPPQPRLLTAFLKTLLRLRGKLSGLFPDRRKAYMYSETKLRSYPDGFKLEELGPPAMLGRLNRAEAITNKTPGAG